MEIQNQGKNGMIDETDRKILDLLQRDARTPNAAIAREVDMAPSAVFERIRKLTEKGYVKAYEARLSASKLGLGLLAFVHVRTNELANQSLAAYDLAAIPEVQEVYNIAGEDCYLLKVRAGSTEELGRLLREKVGAIPQVVSTRTTIVMETYKETNYLPLDQAVRANCD